MLSKRLSTCGYKGGIEAVEKGGIEAMGNAAPHTIDQSEIVAVV